MPNKFVRPSLQEVRDYCASRGSSVDPEAWMDYYTSCGFVVGRTRKPMKDWQAAVRTWERNDRAARQLGRQTIKEKLLDRSWAK